MTMVVEHLAIIGEHLIPEKLKRTIEKMMELKMLKKVNYIMFDASGNPRCEDTQVYGLAEKQSLGIIVNLQKHIENAIETMHWSNCATLRIDCRLYWSLLNTLIHETLECDYLWEQKYENPNKEKPSEETIDGIAEELIDELARDYIDIEPEMSSWMLQKLAEVYKEIEAAGECNPTTGNEDIKSVQNYMFKHGLILIDTEDGDRIKSFREYRRLISNSVDNPNWYKPFETIKTEEVKPVETKQVEVKVPQVSENTQETEYFAMNEDQVDFSEEEASYGEESYYPEETGYEVATAAQPQTQFAKAAAIDYSIAVISGLPNNGHIPDEAFKTAIVSLANRMHSHIFQKCGWSPIEAGSGFTSAWNVTDPLYVADIPYIQEILVGFDKMSITNGQMTKKVCHPVDWNGKPAGCITGLVFTKSGLPAFNIYINYKGKQYARALIPQNKNGSGKFATLARNGEKISYLKDRNTKDVFNNIGAVVGNKSFEFWPKKK